MFKLISLLNDVIISPPVIDNTPPDYRFRWIIIISSTAIVLSIAVVILLIRKFRKNKRGK